MAIYHMQAKVVSRGSGRSAVAASAYMSCSRMYNDYDGIQHDYTRKQGLIYQEVMLPPMAPLEWNDREQLWNAVEETEKTKDSRLAREFVVALPVELDKDSNISLLQDFIKKNFVDMGMCADFAIHDTDGHNPHAHILLTVRPLNENGTWQYKTAGLLAKLTPDYMDVTFWIIIVFIYYMLATLLPVDKIIGKIYPLFAIALLFMAVGILAMLIWHHPALPEITDGIQNTHPAGLPIFPIMFVSIACGAISGFHATQSPLMARCMKNEKYGRPIFYGAMVTEGIVALIWAAAATYFFHQNGMEESNASIIVDRITKEWLGTIGGLLAVLGVIAAPITSGDTALRSARLIVADFMHLEQKSITRRLLICIPIFAVTIGILLYSQRDAAGFDMIWRYFAWCNQTLSVFTLWAITVYLVRMKKNYYVTLLPALFMTAVCSTYICIAPEGLALSGYISYVLGGICTLVAVIGFITWYKKQNSIVYEEI